MEYRLDRYEATEAELAGSGVCGWGASDYTDEQTLSVKGADKSQKTLADRLLGYYRSHAPKSCDILIGTQQIFNVPTNLRRYVTCWCIYPRRVSPQTYNAIAQVCQLDRSTLKTCLGFCEGDYSFLLVSLVGDERGRVRVNGWRAVHGIL